MIHLSLGRQNKVSETFQLYNKLIQTCGFTLSGRQFHDELKYHKLQ